MSITITIGGVSIMPSSTSKKLLKDTLRLTNAIGQRDTLTFTVSSEDGSYVPAEGAAVTVTHSELGALFGGSIRNQTIRRPGITEIWTDCECTSYEAIFDRRLTGAKTYENQTAGDIFQDLFDSFVGGEDITATVVLSGPTIESFTVDFCTVREAFDKLCELASTGDDTFMWTCDAAGVTRFFKQSSFAAPINIDESRTDVFRNSIAISRSFDKFGNRVFVRLGKYIRDPQTQIFHPDGTQRSFSVDKPIAVKPTITLDSGSGPVTQTVGIRDVDTGKQWYWQDGSALIEQDPSETIPSDTSELSVTFQGYQSEVIDAATDSDSVTERSIAEGGTGWYMVLLENQSGTTTADAQALGTAYLSKFATVPTIVEYETTYGGIKAGQHQDITLSSFGVSIASTFIIESSVLAQTTGRYTWKIKAVDGALLGDWKTKLRQIATGGITSASGTAAAGTGETTPAPYPDAPNVTSAWISGLTANYIPYGHDVKVSAVSGTITPPGGTNLTDLAAITIVITGPGLSTKTTQIVERFFSAGSAHPFSVALDDVLDPAAGTVAYGIKFLCENEDGAITASPYSTTVTATPATLSIAAAETAGARHNPPDGQRGLLTSIDLTPTITNNPLGSGKLTITVWESHDWGGTIGVVQTWKGWFDVAGAGGSIITIPDVWVTTKSTSVTVTVKSAIGAWDKEKPLPTVVTATFTMATVSTLLSSTCTNGSLLGIKYSRIPGGFEWAWTGLQYTAPLASNSQFWFARLFLSKGVLSGGVWTSDPNYPEWPVGDTEDPGNTINYTTGVVQTQASPPDSFPGPSDPYPTFRWRLLAFTRKDGDTGVVQNCWNGSEPSGGGNASDNSYVYFTPDITKAYVSAADLDPATVGNRLAINSGVLGVSTPAAPAPVSVTVTTVRSTSAGTLTGIGTLQLWNADLTIRLNTAHANYSHTKDLVISVTGYADRTLTSWSPNGSGDITVTLASEYQTGSTQSLTVSVVARNEDSVPSTAATATISVPASTTSPGGTAGAAAVIVTASASAVYFKYGHDWQAGFTGSFTAPSDALLPNTKYVKISAISPSGQRVWDYDYPAPSGGFVATTAYTFASGAILYVGVSETWTIEFLPVNSDNIPATVKNVSVTVGPNVLTAVSGSEDTSARFIEPGGGGKTFLSISPTITSVAGLPQTVTRYVSKDSGTTWEWIDWVDIAASGETEKLEVWRPLDADKTCRVAMVIGAAEKPITATISSLPSGAVQSSNFTLAKIGAPLSSSVTSASIVTRTATGGALYNDVVLSKTGDGVAYWGLPDGIQWTNPTWAADPNFWYSTITAECVNSSGTNAPTDQGGLESSHIQEFDQPGAVCLTRSVDGWEFNPVGSTFTRMRFKIWVYSRSGQRTLQACWPGGATFKDVIFGDAPSPTILATVTAGSGISVSGSTVSVKLLGTSTPTITNAGFESGLTGWNGAGNTGGWGTTGFFQRSGSLAAFTSNKGAVLGQLATGSAAPGETHQFQAWAQRVNSVSCFCYVFIRFMASDGVTAIGSNWFGSFANPSIAGWQPISITAGPAPAGTAKVEVNFYTDTSGGFQNPGSDGWAVDDCVYTPPSTGAATVGLDGSGYLQVPDLSLVTAKFGNLSVDTTKLANLAATSAKLANAAVDNTKLASLAVQAANLASGSVTSSAIANSSVYQAAIQFAAVGTAAIANAAVGSAAIASLAVGNAQIQDLAITNAKINDILANKITGGTITATIQINSPFINGGSMQIVSGSRALNVDSSNGFRYTDTGILVQILQTTGEPFLGNGGVVVQGANFPFDSTDRTLLGPSGLLIVGPSGIGGGYVAITRSGMTVRNGLGQQKQYTATGVI